MNPYFQYDKEKADFTLKILGCIGTFLATWTGAYFSADAVKENIGSFFQYLAVWVAPVLMFLPTMFFMIYVDPFGTTGHKIFIALVSSFIPFLVLLMAVVVRLFLVCWGTTGNPGQVPAPQNAWRNGKFWVLLLAVFGFELLFWQQALDLFTSWLGKPS